MKKLLLIFLLSFGTVSAKAQIAPTHPFSVLVGVNRTTRLDSVADFNRKEFNLVLTLSIPFKKRFAFQTGLTESLEFRQPLLRVGVSARIY